MQKNDCLSCVILEYTTCPLLDLLYKQKKYEGLTGCQMRKAVEITMTAHLDQTKKGPSAKHAIPSRLMDRKRRGSKSEK